MDNRNNDPIVGEAEPSGPAAWFANLRSALSAMRERARARPTPVPRTEVKAKRAKAQAPTPAAGRDNDGASEAAAKVDRAIHGPPAIWMAPFFLAFAALYGAPIAASFLNPGNPRATLDGWVAALPEPLALLSPMLAGWLWAPWWVVLPATFMRLRGAWVTRRAILDAVGWGMGALAFEGAAWLYFGRDALKAGFSAAEQTGCWRLLVAEFLFLLLTAILFGPVEKRQWYQRSADD